MRRGLAIFFLLVANITLLVHAAVPHHNHEGDFCLITTEIETDCHEHKSHQHQHKHHGDPKDLKCELNTKVIIPNNINPKLEVIVLELIHLPSINFDYIRDFLNNSNTYISGLNLKRKIPLKLSLYCIYTSSSKGLRAPPSLV